LSRCLVLTASLAAGCASVGPPPLPPPSPADDPVILNNLLALELEAVAAYEAAGQFLPPARAEAAAQFRAEHRRHADTLIAAIRQHGTSPVGPVTFLGIMTDEPSALSHLADAERGLASAYLGAVPAFADRDLARMAASILAVEMLHWAEWRRALGNGPSGGAFFSELKAE